LFYVSFEKILFLKHVSNILLNPANVSNVDSEI